LIGPSRWIHTHMDRPIALISHISPTSQADTQLQTAEPALMSYTQSA
jgi:hypothetical protein